ncbi:MAG: hypothetical protein IJ835_04960 [Muribaculaceae bacterium]|nr:hypothetical protein [Muribaculaceae bacterium]
MNLEVTQDNLYLFLAGKTAWMVDRLREATGISLSEAFSRIYSSATYKKLEREDSKYWHLGPVALYEIFCEENEKKEKP